METLGLSLQPSLRSADAFPVVASLPEMRLRFAGYCNQIKLIVTLLDFHSTKQRLPLVDPWSRGLNVTMSPLGLHSLVLLVWVKERERVSGKVSNERFVNSCLANSPSVYIYTAIRIVKILVHNFH